MPSISASSAGAYNSFAEAYAAQSDTSLFNGYYTHPAVVNLAGEVAGHRVLEVSCVTGSIAARLRDLGAIVTGFDSSAGMLELARRRLGSDADLHLGDLDDPLPFPDATFDDVVAALVLHYLQDWTGPLAELRRVLKPGGRLIAALDHPFAIELLYRQETGRTAYFETRSWTEDWTFGGHTAPMTFWTRPLHAMTDAFTRAGFRITAISEPPPAPDTPREVWAKHFPDGDPRPFLCFIFFVLEAA